MKCAQYAVGEDRSPDLVATALAEEIGRSTARLSVSMATGELVHEGALELPDHQAALRTVLEALASSGQHRPVAVGHRVVHGGPHLLDHVVIDASVRQRLREARPFAPLHLPPEISAIGTAVEQFPDAVQVACFDTAFHRTLPAIARRLPLPGWADAAGVRRYGFHGLSCEYVAQRLGAEQLGRAIVAHLGSGASLTAVRDGQSIDTTMGFTPTGGVVMGTRTGDVDPGALAYLMRERDLDAAALEHLVNHESGLLGLSGGSADMRELLRNEANDSDAALAVAVFCSSVRKAIGALTTVLDGVDTIVFAGGIGEGEPVVRARICAGLSHLGVELDPDRNQVGGSAVDGVISREQARTMVRVVNTDENLVIAQHTIRLSGR